MEQDEFDESDNIIMDEEEEAASVVSSGNITSSDTAIWGSVDSVEAGGGDQQQAGPSSSLRANKNLVIPLKRTHCATNLMEPPPKRTSFSPVGDEVEGLVLFPAPSPIYRGYELLGDSQLIHFADQYLTPAYSAATYGDMETRRLGYNVNTQRISELHSLLLADNYNITNRVILLIGTYDILANSPLTVMAANFKILLANLRVKSERVVILTLPPIPKIVENSSYTCKLVQFNKILLSHHDGNQVHVVDLASRYATYQNVLPAETHGQGSSSNDQLNLSFQGYELLRIMLQEYFEQFI